MPRIPRASDVIEILSEQSLSFAFGGIVSIALGGLLLRYRGAGSLINLAYLLIAAGACAIVWAIVCALKVRKVTTFDLNCPYCDELNVLVAPPEEDFPCIKCIRMIPVVDGKPLAVSQVRCGYCNELNFYSDKTEEFLWHAKKCNARDSESHSMTRGPRKTIRPLLWSSTAEALLSCSLLGQDARQRN